MDINLVVLCGQLAVPAEHRRFESGASQLRLLITVRTDMPHRRIDLIPVILWDPSDDLTDGSLTPGKRVCVSGMLRRRFWELEATAERRSGLEVVAMKITDEVATEDLVDT